MDKKYFTFGGKNNNEKIVYYDDLPLCLCIKLDQNITVRSVHLGSEFAKSALKGGYDPEKVSFNTLVKEGLIGDNSICR